MHFYPITADLKFLYAEVPIVLPGNSSIYAERCICAYSGRNETSILNEKYDDRSA